MVVHIQKGNLSSSEGQLKPRQGASISGVALRMPGPEDGTPTREWAQLVHTVPETGSSQKPLLLSMPTVLSRPPRPEGRTP